MPGVKPPRVPEGLRDLMKNLAKEVLREKPPDIYKFSAQYFESMLEEKKDFDFQGFEVISSYETIFKKGNGRDQTQIPLALVYAIIPDELTQLIKEFIKAVLRANPRNICEFAVEYFRRLLQQRHHKSSTVEYTAYENYFKSTQRWAFTPYVKCVCGRTFGEGVMERTDIQRKDETKLRRVEQSTRNGFDKSEAVKSNTKTVQTQQGKSSAEVAKDRRSEQLNEEYINAIHVLQRFFRRALAKQRATNKKLTKSVKQEKYKYYTMTEETAAIIIQRTLRKVFSKESEITFIRKSVPTSKLEQVTRTSVDINDNVSEAASYTSASTAVISAASTAESSELGTKSRSVSQEEMKHGDGIEVKETFRKVREAETEVESKDVTDEALKREKREIEHEILKNYRDQSDAGIQSESGTHIEAKHVDVSELGTKNMDDTHKATKIQDQLGMETKTKVEDQAAVEIKQKQETSKMQTKMENELDTLTETRKESRFEEKDTSEPDAKVENKDEIKPATMPQLKNEQSLELSKAHDNAIGKENMALEPGEAERVTKTETEHKVETETGNLKQPAVSVNNLEKVGTEIEKKHLHDLNVEKEVTNESQKETKIKDITIAALGKNGEHKVGTTNVGSSEAETIFEPTQKISKTADTQMQIEKSNQASLEKNIEVHGAEIAMMNEADADAEVKKEIEVDVQKEFENNQPEMQTKSEEELKIQTDAENEKLLAIKAQSMDLVTTHKTSNESMKETESVDKTVAEMSLQTGNESERVKADENEALPETEARTDTINEGMLNEATVKMENIIEPNHEKSEVLPMAQNGHVPIQQSSTALSDVEATKKPETQLSVDSTDEVILRKLLSVDAQQENQHFNEVEPLIKRTQVAGNISSPAESRVSNEKSIVSEQNAETSNEKEQLVQDSLKSSKASDVNSSNQEGLQSEDYISPTPLFSTANHKIIDVTQKFLDKEKSLALVSYPGLSMPQIEEDAREQREELVEGMPSVPNENGKETLSTITQHTESKDVYLKPHIESTQIKQVEETISPKKVETLESEINLEHEESLKQSYTPKTSETTSDVNKESEVQITNASEHGKRLMDNELQSSPINVKRQEIAHIGSLESKESKEIINDVKTELSDANVNTDTMEQLSLAGNDKLIDVTQTFLDEEKSIALGTHPDISTSEVQRKEISEATTSVLNEDEIKSVPVKSLNLLTTSKNEHIKTHTESIDADSEETRAPIIERSAENIAIKRDEESNSAKKVDTLESEINLEHAESLNQSNKTISSIPEDKTKLDNISAEDELQTTEVSKEETFDIDQAKESLESKKSIKILNNELSDTKVNKNTFEQLSLADNDKIIDVTQKFLNEEKSVALGSQPDISTSKVKQTGDEQQKEITVEEPTKLNESENDIEPSKVVSPHTDSKDVYLKPHTELIDADLGGTRALTKNRMSSIEQIEEPTEIMREQETISSKKVGTLQADTDLEHMESLSQSSKKSSDTTIADDIQSTVVKAESTTSFVGTTEHAVDDTKITDKTGLTANVDQFVEPLKVVVQTVDNINTIEKNAPPISTQSKISHELKTVSGSADDDYASSYAEKNKISEVISTESVKPSIDDTKQTAPIDSNNFGLESRTLMGDTTAKNAEEKTEKVSTGSAPIAIDIADTKLSDNAKSVLENNELSKGDSLNVTQTLTTKVDTQFDGDTKFPESVDETKYSQEKVETNKQNLPESGNRMISSPQSVQKETEKPTEISLNKSDLSKTYNVREKLSTDSPGTHLVTSLDTDNNDSKLTAETEHSIKRRDVESMNSETPLQLERTALAVDSIPTQSIDQIAAKDISSVDLEHKNLKDAANFGELTKIVDFEDTKTFNNLSNVSKAVAKDKEITNLSEETRNVDLKKAQASGKEQDAAENDIKLAEKQESSTVSNKIIDELTSSVINIKSPKSADKQTTALTSELTTTAMSGPKYDVDAQTDDVQSKEESKKLKENTRALEEISSKVLPLDERHKSSENIMMQNEREEVLSRTYNIADTTKTADIQQVTKGQDSVIDLVPPLKTDATAVSIGSVGTSKNEEVVADLSVKDEQTKLIDLKRIDSSTQPSSVNHIADASNEVIKTFESGNEKDNKNKSEKEDKSIAKKQNEIVHEVKQVISSSNTDEKFGDTGDRKTDHGQEVADPVPTIGSDNFMKSGTNISDEGPATDPSNLAIGNLTTEPNIGTQNSNENSIDTNSSSTNTIDNSKTVKKSKLPTKDSKNVKEHFIGRPLDARIAELHLKSFKLADTSVPWYETLAPNEPETTSTEAAKTEQAIIKDASSKLDDSGFQEGNMDKTTSESLQEKPEGSKTQSTEIERVPTYLYGVHTPRQTPTESRKIYKKPTAFTIPLDGDATYINDDVFNMDPEESSEGVKDNIAESGDHTRPAGTIQPLDMSPTEEQLDLISPTKLFAEIDDTDSKNLDFKVFNQPDETETAEGHSDEDNENKPTELILDTIIELNESGDNNESPYLESDTTGTASNNLAEKLLLSEHTHERESADASIPNRNKRDITIERKEDMNQSDDEKEGMTNISRKETGSGKTFIEDNNKSIELKKRDDKELEAQTQLKDSDEIELKTSKDDKKEPTLSKAYTQSTIMSKGSEATEELSHSKKLDHKETIVTRESIESTAQSQDPVKGKKNNTEAGDLNELDYKETMVTREITKTTTHSQDTYKKTIQESNVNKDTTDVSKLDYAKTTLTKETIESTIQSQDTYAVTMQESEDKKGSDEVKELVHKEITVTRESIHSTTQPQDAVQGSKYNGKPGDLNEWDHKDITVTRESIESTSQPQDAVDHKDVTVARESIESTTQKQDAVEGITKNEELSDLRELDHKERTVTRESILPTTQPPEVVEGSKDNEKPGDLNEWDHKDITVTRESNESTTQPHDAVGYKDITVTKESIESTTQPQDAVDHKDVTVARESIESTTQKQDAVEGITKNEELSDLRELDHKERTVTRESILPTTQPPEVVEGSKDNEKPGDLNELDNKNITVTRESIESTTQPQDAVDHKDITVARESIESTTQKQDAVEGITKNEELSDLRELDHKERTVTRESIHPTTQPPEVVEGSKGNEKPGDLNELDNKNITVTRESIESTTQPQDAVDHKDVTVARESIESTIQPQDAVDHKDVTVTRESIESTTQPHDAVEGIKKNEELDELKTLDQEIESTTHLQDDIQGNKDNRKLSDLKALGKNTQIVTKQLHGEPILISTSVAPPQSQLEDTDKSVVQYGVGNSEYIGLNEVENEEPLVQKKLIASLESPPHTDSIEQLLRQAPTPPQHDPYSEEKNLKPSEIFEERTAPEMAAVVIQTWFRTHLAQKRTEKSEHDRPLESTDKLKSGRANRSENGIEEVEIKEASKSQKLSPPSHAHIEQIAATIIQKAFRKYLVARGTSRDLKLSHNNSWNSSQTTQIYVDDEQEKSVEDAQSLPNSEDLNDLPEENKSQPAEQLTPTIGTAEQNEKVNWFVGTEPIRTKEEEGTEVLPFDSSATVVLNRSSIDNEHGSALHGTSTPTLVSDSSHSLESVLVDDANKLHANESLHKNSIFEANNPVELVSAEQIAGKIVKAEKEHLQEGAIHETGGDGQTMKSSRENGADIEQSVSSSEQQSPQLTENEEKISNIEPTLDASDFVKKFKIIEIISTFLVAEREHSKRYAEERTNDGIDKEMIAIAKGYLDSQKVSSQSDIPYEKLESQCIKKSVSLTYLGEDEEATEAHSNATSTDADTEADAETSQDDSLDKMANKLRETDEIVERMQKRRASKSSSGSLEGKASRGASFEEPVIQTMQDLQSSVITSPDLEDDKVVLNRLQREDTRESSAQSDCVVFGPADEGELQDMPAMKVEIKRSHTTPGEDTKMLQKSVTIDETVKYIEPHELGLSTTSSSSLCLDDDTSENIRQKMMAYSLSEADSDVIESDVSERDMLEKTARADFNISTALLDAGGTSTETESTIVAAANKSRAGTAGGDTISESLEQLVQDESARKIQKAYRQYRQHKNLQHNQRESQQTVNSENSLAARRMTLQRGDALRNDSAPDEAHSSGENNGYSLKLAEAKTETSGAVDNAKMTKKSTTAIASKRPKKIIDSKLKWLSLRQNSMPVQIESEILRVIPKHMRKRIRSAEDEKKGRQRILKD